MESVVFSFRKFNYPFVLFQYHASLNSTFVANKDASNSSQSFEHRGSRGHSDRGSFRGNRGRGRGSFRGNRGNGRGRGRGGNQSWSQNKRSYQGNQRDQESKRMKEDFVN